MYSPFRFFCSCPATGRLIAMSSFLFGFPLRNLKDLPVEGRIDGSSDSEKSFLGKLGRMFAAVKQN